MTKGHTCDRDSYLQPDKPHTLLELIRRYDLFLRDGIVARSTTVVVPCWDMGSLVACHGSYSVSKCMKEE